jgi:hypothetical protein
MGYQVIRQPDGQFAVFTSYTDSWAVCDASPEEVTDRAAAESRRQAERVVGAVLRGEPQEIYGRYAETFEEANEMRRDHGGMVVP